MSPDYVFYTGIYNNILLPKIFNADTLSALPVWFLTYLFFALRGVETAEEISRLKG